MGWRCGFGLGGEDLDEAASSILAQKSMDGGTSGPVPRDAKSWTFD